MPLLYEKFMSGRTLLCWRHKITYDVVRQRYLASKIHQRTLHMDIANLFFSEFSKDDSESKTDGCKYNNIMQRHPLVMLIPFFVRKNAKILFFFFYVKYKSLIKLHICMERNNCYQLFLSETFFKFFCFLNDYHYI